MSLVTLFYLFLDIFLKKKKTQFNFNVSHKTHQIYLKRIRNLFKNIYFNRIFKKFEENTRTNIKALRFIAFFFIFELPFIENSKFVIFMNSFSFAEFVILSILNNFNSNLPFYFHFCI